MQTRMSSRTTCRTLALCGALSVTALFSIAPASANAASCRGADADPGSTEIKQVQSTTLCLINRERTKRGLRKLRHNSKLGLAATRHSQDMARRRYFSHDSLGGRDMVDRIKGTNYVRASQAWALAENIGYGTGGSSTPRTMVRMWMDSPGHRANILNRRFREIGIGVARGAPSGNGGSGATYTTDFGARG